MTETKFVAGDRIKFWAKDDPEKIGECVLVHCNETREECSGLHMYNLNDPKLPFVDFYEAVVGHPELFGYELDTPFSEALPTVPGRYIEDIEAISAESIAKQYPDIPGPIVELIVQGMIESGEVTGGSEVWTLNEDGTWTDPDGGTESADKNWMLVAANYEFIPAPEGGEGAPVEAKPFA